MQTIFYNAHLVDANTDCQGAVLVNDDTIFAVIHGDFSDADSARNLANLFRTGENCTSGNCSGCKTDCELNFVNCRGQVLMPSFIDMHVHFRYPGQTQKEDLSTGLNAAVAGGYGTLVLMPNTNPVVSTSELAHSIEEDAAKFGKAQVFQSVSLTKDFDGKTTTHLDDLHGVPLLTEDGHDVQNSLVMLDAMEKAAVKGAIVSCHCEDEAFNAEARKLRLMALENYTAYDNSQSNENPDAQLSLLQAQTFMEQANRLLALAEDNATFRNLELAEKAGCRIHIAHVSTKNSLEAIKKAWANSDFAPNVTCEVMPHHFALEIASENVRENEDETYEDKNLRLIVNPPIRNNADRISLVQALCDKNNDNIVISTDHAPHTLEDKQNGAPGFPGLETAFAVAYTTLVKTDNCGIKRLSELMSANPARILNLHDRGILASNKKANLVLVDTNEDWIVDSSKFFTKGKMCPFEGMELTGKVVGTWFCGQKVF